ncbi:UNVERIFIED_CONTAM: hypothetical protein Cloal_3435 [Acetivibrio alkalicellulosi]
MKVTSNQPITNKYTQPVQEKKTPKGSESKPLQDQYISIENQEKKITYEKVNSRTDNETIQKLKEQSDRIYNNLREMVRQLLEKQGMEFKETDFIQENEKLAFQELDLAEELSPENVSQRIIDFAKAISGGDIEKFALLKEAIENGFNKAAKALGGELPEISKKTYELVMEKLNEWKNESLDSKLLVENSR